MTAAISFALYATAAGLLAPVLLRRQWAASSPRLAIALWLLFPASWVAAVLLAMLAVAAPIPLSWSGSPASDRTALLAGPPVPGGRAIAVAALLLAAAIVLRAAGSVIEELYRGRRSRREHAVLIAASVRRPSHEPGVAIVDQDAPNAYCLPCGEYQIVLTAGAVAALSPEQLRAVLAHERAHLRCRHHLILALATALARAFPHVPLLAQAQRQLAVLTEMAADDVASRRHCRDDLATALVVLARAGARHATLAAGGPATAARLQRILDPKQPRTGLAKLAAAAGLIPPAAIVCLPLILAACDATSRP